MPIEHYQRQIGFNTVPVIHPVIFADDCSGTFNYETDGDGDDFLAEYDPAAALVQLNGILLKTRETEPAEDDFVYIHRGLWLPPLRIIRFQLCFAQPEDTPDLRATAVLVWGDGENLHHAGIQTNSVDGHVSYVSGGSTLAWTYTEIPGLITQMAKGVWNHLDLSLDLQANTYHLLHLNQFAVDLGALDVPLEGIPLVRYLAMYVFLETRSAAQQVLYVDQILITPENP